MKIYVEPATSHYDIDVIFRSIQDSSVRLPIADIKNVKIHENTALYGVKWYGDPTTFNENDHLLIAGYKSIEYQNAYQIALSTTTDSLITDTTALTPKSFMKLVTLKQPVVAVVSEDKFEYYNACFGAALQLETLYRYFPIYKNVITFEDNKPKLASLLDLIFTLEPQEQHDMITAFSYANHHNVTLKNLAEHVLEKVNTTNGQDLMTQEQQVESFISFSKLIADEKYETVPDSMITNLKESPAYARVLAELKAGGFGASKTQQFNAIQAALYLGGHERDSNVIYNLSDMGAGKTLMTVESIYLMDLKIVDRFNHHPKKAEALADAISMWLPSKNLIAPKLSVKSSWLKTFELFYKMKKLSDEQYELSFVQDGITYYSYINISAFTARTNAVAVDAKLPNVISDRDYLIIDEIHQLIKRKINRTKFFPSNVVPANKYYMFILSGTLSNLNTTEWLNYINFTGVDFNERYLDNSSPKTLESIAENQNDALRQDIANSADNLSSEQRRYFDPESFGAKQTTTNQKKMSNKDRYFNLKYASKVVSLAAPSKPLQGELINRNFTLRMDDNVAVAPNFELFYQLVGNCAITAQSTQVAEELFGEQKTQHNASVINVPSSLSDDDLSLLRSLHKITTDYNIYKSSAIATAINNAILNLNDGLATKNIYELLNQYANSNTRFLAYLSTLDLDILEKLPQSGLINQPELTKTPKFEVLQDLLAKESSETFLIVVNDFSAMTKLAKALKIDSITRTQLKNPLNYQDVLDEMFAKQNIVIVPQMMIKSSLDLVQANRLIQYQLNTEISDIIQTQNRINRIGQTRETKAFYIATDVLQKNIIELFLETYKNIRVAHKGIVELFVDMNSQVNVVNDYIAKAMKNIGTENVQKDVEYAQNPAQDAQEVHETVAEMSTTTPSFNDNGVMDLFGFTEPIEEVTENVVENLAINSLEIVTDTKQQDLFAPVEHAVNHQLILVR